MKRIIPIAVLLAGAAGCSAPRGPELWTHPTIGDEQRVRDEYVCDTKAENMTTDAFNRMWAQRYYEKCMATKGYRRQGS